jgi:hypothetical protein
MKAIITLIVSLLFMFISCKGLLLLIPVEYTPVPDVEYIEQQKTFGSTYIDLNK